MTKENDFSYFTALTFEKDAKPVWPFPKKYIKMLKNAFYLLLPIQYIQFNLNQT
jgi:hypothetical protein